MQTTDDNADDNTTTQAIGNNADDDDAAADVNAVTKTTRCPNNQPEKRHGGPWRNEVAVAVAVDMDRATARERR